MTWCARGMWQTPEVLAVVKSFQPSTRQLQSICAHSKVMRDASMMAAVKPAVLADPPRSPVMCSPLESTS